jgi:hypothetical protein
LLDQLILWYPAPVFMVALRDRVSFTLMVALVLVRPTLLTAGWITVTVQVAVFVLPSVFVTVTVMVAVPAALPVTLPELFTVAALELLDQLILWYPAPEGLTVAVRST